MKNNKKLISVICICLLVVVLVACSIFVSGKETHACHDCDGSGLCASCGGEGTVDDLICADCVNLDGKCPSCEGEGEVAADSKYSETFVALLPPVIAIALALITKEVYSSLFVGVVVGAFLYSNYSFLTGLDVVVNDGLISAVADNAGIFIFLVILGVVVALINKAGGSAAFGKWAATHIKSRVGAALATFAFGVLIFIDDYFNCLTVGSVMRPVTDSHKISRSKLAYLIDATAAPICMIAPISSWAAAVSAYAEDGQGLKLFINAIPYNYYSLLTFVFIIVLTYLKFDYGTMAKHEFNALQNGDLFSGDKGEAAAEEIEVNPKGKVIDLLFPIIALIAICVFALVYVGGIFDGCNFIDAFSNTDAYVGLSWGAIIALVITIAYLLVRKVVTFKEAMECIPKGFNAMVPAILILTLATALKNTTSLLGAKYFVGALMDSAAAGLDMFLPAIIFLVACGLAFATGTSWGTFGILIPIVTAIFPAGSVLGTIGISACLAGAVCGDHCSPISDTTIMSSAGAQCNHLNHVSTQLPYAITVAAVSFVTFIFAGLIQNAIICLAIGIVLMIATLFVIKAVVKKKQA